MKMKNIATFMSEGGYDFSVKLTYWTISFFVIPIAISLFFFQ